MRECNVDFMMEKDMYTSVGYNFRLLVFVSKSNNNAYYALNPSDAISIIRGIPTAVVVAHIALVHAVYYTNHG